MRQISLLLFTVIVLSGSARADIGDWDWTLWPGASLNGNVLTTQTCTPDRPVDYVFASAITDQPGIVTLSLDWEVLGDNSFTETFVRATDYEGLIYHLGDAWGPEWCSPPPCGGSEPSVSFPVEAGVKISWTIDAIEVGCSFSPGSPTEGTILTYTIDFETTAGFSPAGPGLDGSVIGVHSPDKNLYIFGQSICFVGDTNGDGVDDYALGKPGYDDPNVTIFSGADGGALTSVAGNYPANFGWELAAVGDMNGDGVTDLAVTETDPSVFQTSDAEVRVFSGVNLHSSSSLIHSFPTPNTESGTWGKGLTGPGDCDGDGIPDLAVGDPEANGTGIERGTVHLLSGADGHVIWSVSGSQDMHHFGWDIDSAGDVNGDGTPDLVVGVPGYGTSPVMGQVKVLSGFDGSLIHRNNGAVPGTLGLTVVGPGDVNGDGILDYGAGTPDEMSFGEGNGMVSIYSGASGTLLYQVWGEGRDALGTSLESFGDADGNGLGDFIAGAPGMGATDPLNYVVVFDGQDGSEILRTGKPWHSLWFGQEIAAGGNLDGDGYPDFIVSDPGDHNHPWHMGGRAHLYHGDPAVHQTPKLTGTGDLLPTTPLSLEIGTAPPFGTGMLFIGLSSIYAPFKGGIFIPSPDLAIPLSMGPSGDISFTGTWPAGIPSGFSIQLQAWFLSSMGPKGLIATNGLRATAP